MKTFSEYKSSSDSRLCRLSAQPLYTLFPKDKDELKQMIHDEIDKQSSEEHLSEFNK